MVSGKKRLYIALYPSGVTNNEERRYHWGFIVGPKKEGSPEVPGMRYHVKNRPIEGWMYEEIELADVRNTTYLLVRLLIAKVKDERRLVEIVRQTPVVQDDPNWRCRTWVADVLGRIRDDSTAVGTAELDWGVIEPKGRAYVAEKTAAARFATAESLTLPKPTWDMLQQKEVLP